MIKSIETENGKISYELLRKNVKNINFRIKTDGIVYISAARAVPEEYIKGLLRKNSLKFVSEINRLKENAKKSDNEDGFHLLGKKYAVEFIPSRENRAVLTDRLRVYAERKELLDRITEDFLTEKINEVFPKAVERVRRLIEREGLPAPTAIRVKDMKSRWGSCSLKTGAISLNRRLIKYPTGCLEYVILHEMAHFRHRGHDKSFYGFVEKYMKDYKKYEAILREPLD